MNRMKAMNESARYWISRSPAAALVLTAALLASCASAPKGKPEPGDYSPLLVRPGSNSPGEALLYPLKGKKIALEGSLDTEGLFIIEGVSWFTNWQDGWTEARLIASGSLKVIGEGKKLCLEPQEPMVILSADSARIRYRDSVLSHDDAKAALDRRLIRAETAAMALREAFEDRNFPVFSGKNKKTRRESFEQCAGSYLFPEIYGYPEGSAPSPKTAENRVRGEDLLWDRRYTEGLDPRLTEVRNSGTLWRDWEECPELFYLMYQMEK